MAKYIFTKDFEATEYRYRGDAKPPDDLVQQPLLKQTFKKGTIVTGFKSLEFDLSEHITVIVKVGGGTNDGKDVSFEVTSAVVPYIAGTTEPTTKYYNVTVNTAKYGYKVGDAIVVYTDAMSAAKVTADYIYKYYTKGKPTEIWNIGGIAGLKDITVDGEAVVTAEPKAAESKAIDPNIFLYTGIGAAAIFGAYHFGWDYANKFLKIGAKSNWGYVISVAAGLGLGYWIYSATSKKETTSSMAGDCKCLKNNPQI
jgi:hypothetical protein